MSSKNLGFNKTGIPPHATRKLVDLSLDKASSELKKYVNGERKTRPSKKMLEILEENGVISKTGSGYSKVGGGIPKIAVMPQKPMPSDMTGGKVNRLKKANRWADFSKEQVKDGIDLGSYGYDAYKKATDPYGHALAEAITGGKVNRIKKANRWADFSKEQVKDGIDLGSYGYDAYKKATDPYGHALAKAVTGGSAKKPSAWISFVKEYAQKNNIPYKEALKSASGPYKKLKSGSGYSSAN